MDRLGSIAALREMLRQMESDVGFERLSRTERDVLLAAHSVAEEPGAVVASDRIRNHSLLQPVAQATYHRALRNLVERGFLERAGTSKARHYVVRHDLFEE